MAMPLSVLYPVTSYVPAVGGAQIHLHELIKQLFSMDEGFTAHVLTQWTQFRQDFLLGTTLNSPEEETSFVVDGVPVTQFILDKRLLRRKRFLIYLFYVIRWLAIPVLSDIFCASLDMHYRGESIVHNVRMGRENISYACLKLARKQGVPAIFTPVHHPRWKGWIYEYFIRLYKQADGIIALTKAEKAMLVDMGIAPQKIYVTGIGPVLSPEADGARFRKKYQVNGPMVLFVGQHHPAKGIAELLRAAGKVTRLFSDVVFVFIGPETAYSKALFSKYQDQPCFRFLGTVDLQEKTDAFAACDIFCFPSSQESFGGVFTEAWTMKKAVIGVDIPAVREIISHGEDGILIRQYVSEIADAICFLLSNDGLRAKMGRCGYTKVAQRYTWTRIAGRTLDVYRRVLKGQPAPS